MKKSEKKKKKKEKENRKINLISKRDLENFLTNSKRNVMNSSEKLFNKNNILRNQRMKK